MATTTTNFGWDIPQSTDLVKDGATAIAALGQDIDTAFVDLKGGTTGQLLAKASGTDLDFSWTTPGAGSGSTFISRTTFSNVATVNVDPFTNTYETYLVVIENISGATAADDIQIRGRYSTTTHTGSDYYSVNPGARYDSTAWEWFNTSGGSAFTLIPQTNADYPSQAFLYFNDVGDAGKILAVAGQWATRNGMYTGIFGGEIFSNQTWSGFQLKSSSSNITGAVSVYGLAKA
jgi:hypothetical protein